MARRYAGLLLVVAMAACSGPPGSATTTTAPVVTTVAPATTSPPPSPPTSFTFEVVEVRLDEDAPTPHLLDEEGRSLYLFTLDDDRTSTCEGACAQAWPPLLGDPVAGRGVDQELLGNAERGNGAIQVTYAGHPLYRHRGDARPGDTAGQGFNAVWFLVGADGEAIRE